MKLAYSPKRLQWARRAVQWSVVGLLVLVPAYARYNNYLAAWELDRRLQKWEGTVPGATISAIDATMRALPQGERYRAGEDQRHRNGILGSQYTLRGGPWSAQIGPVSLTDPLAAAESVVASRSVNRVLIVGAAIPILLTLLLGRVFCSWICPMGLLLELNEKLRGVLRFLEIRPRQLRFSPATKYVVLGTGLMVALVVGSPVLAYVYPPAVLNREVHEFVFAVFDRAELGKFSLTASGLSLASALILAIAMFELFVSRRWWCRYVCPGGALYAGLGMHRILRVRLSQSRCTDCVQCVAACPMGLNPMKNQMGSDCDNCGVCISACNDDALTYRLGLRSGDGHWRDAALRREAA